MQQYDKNFLHNCLSAFEQTTEQYCHSERYRKSIDERGPIFHIAFTYFNDLNVLDMGCFTGFYACMMAPYVKSVLGIDVKGRSITQAKMLKKIFQCNNVEFRKFSAFNLTSEFMLENEIKGLFLHKAMSFVSGWTDERQKTFWELMKKHVNVIVSSATSLISDKVDIIRPVFIKDKRFKIIELDAHLIVIVRK